METKCVYETPRFEVYELELEGAVLNASSDDGSSNEGFDRDGQIGWG